MKLVHVHPGAEELGRVYHPASRHQRRADRVLLGAGRLAAAERDSPGKARATVAHADYLAWSGEGDAAAGRGQSRRDHGLAARESAGRRHHHATAPAISPAGSIASTASANTAPRSAPTSGSMGYGFPAALGDEDAVSRSHGGLHCRRRRFPDDRAGFRDRRSIRIAGHRRASPTTALYGTIRMHQEREYPGRVVAHRAAQSGFRRLRPGVRRLRRAGREDRRFPRGLCGGAGDPASRRSSISRSIRKRSRPATSLTAIRDKALAGGGKAARIAGSCSADASALPLWRELSFTHCHALSPHRERRSPPGRARGDDPGRRARRIAAEGGMAAVQIAAVAERAGIAAGTVYRYFPSKTDLVAELVGRRCRPRTRRHGAPPPMPRPGRCRRWPPASPPLPPARSHERRLAWAVIGEPVDAEVDAMRLDFRQSLAAELEARISDRDRRPPFAGAGRRRRRAGHRRRADGRAARTAGAVAGRRRRARAKRCRRATLLALRALGVVDARARGLVAQCVLP